MNKLCPECGNEFSCGVSNHTSPCWCRGFPAIVSVGQSSKCLCPDCLTKLIVSRIELALRSKTLDSQVEMAAQFYRPNELIEYIDYTIEQGNYVFSRWYHLKRGSCCGNGCRHCPYNN